MINILFITANSTIGGGPEHIYSIIQNIDKEKYKPYVVAPANGEYYERFKEIAETFSFDLKKRFLFNLYKLNSIIKEKNIDICHSHGLGAGVYSRPLKIINKKLRVIHTFHGIYYERKEPIIKTAIILIEKMFGLLTDISIAVSNKEKEEALKLGFQKEDKIKVIYNGIDMKKYQIDIDRRKYLKEIGLNLNEDLIFGSVARFNIEKGHKELIEAFKMINNWNNRTKLLLIGDGELRTEIEREIQKFGLAKEVILLGFRDDIPELLKCLDCFVSASYKEGLPYSLIEAIASGVPVVATDVTGNNEIIIDEYDGFLCKARNAESLYLTMVKMYYSEEKCFFIENGKEYARSNFDISSMVKSLEEIYDII